jgi:delta(3,5)-delta(2,4)-dienoyl-CoA isomerase
MLTKQDFQEAISSLEKARQPVIGALYGYSLGLAVDIASACDIRLVAEDVILGIMVSNLFWIAFHFSVKPRVTR